MSLAYELFVYYQGPMTSLASWIFQAIILLSPPEKAVSWASHAEAKESLEDKITRYQSIASDMAEVIEDPEEKLVYSGKFAKERTAALLTSIAWMESGFRRDVDLGIGKKAKGGGLDSCLMQVRLGLGKTTEGWSSEDLTRDRKKCFKVGLAMVRGSFYSCRSLPTEEKLAAYASGNCRMGKNASKARMHVANRVFSTINADK